MTAPVITPLPPAPTRADAPSDFTAKADAFVAAQVGMVAEFNASAAFVDQRAIDADASAQAAADISGLAAQAVQDAADQVALATLAKEGAEYAEGQAQLYAAAAGAASGIPALAGHGGQALIVKADESGVEWGDAASGPEIGDILVTARDPGPTFLPADGGIYLQSAYPDLFAEIGLYGGEPANKWAGISSGTLNNFNLSAATDENGVWVVGGNSSVIARSADNGQNWTAITLPLPISGAGQVIIHDIDTDGNGVWVAVSRGPSGGYGHIFRSADNGETWGLVFDTGATSTVGNPIVCVATDGSGVWVAGRSAGGLLRSTDNGLTWVAGSSGTSLGIFDISTDRSGVWVFTTSQTTVRRSADNGATWATVTTSLPSGSVDAVATDRAGVWIVSGSAAAARSTDNGLTWSLLPALGASYALATNRKGVWVADTKRSVDNGLTWVAATGKAAPGAGFRLACDGGEVFIHNKQRGTTAYDFDPETLFRVPDVDLLSGGIAKPYIKALEAA